MGIVMLYSIYLEIWLLFCLNSVTKEWDLLDKKESANNLLSTFFGLYRLCCSVLMIGLMKKYK
jgi:hypothetical protein